MSEPPRRKRFQIHLSTAVVMMFVAGALIWANVKLRRIDTVGVETHMFHFFGTGGEPRPVSLSQFKNSNERDVWKGIKEIDYGWPTAAIVCKQLIVVNRLDYDEIPYGPKERSISFWLIAYNLLAVLLILFSVWFLCEWLIRRAARKAQ